MLPPPARRARPKPVERAKCVASDPQQLRAACNAWRVPRSSRVCPVGLPHRLRRAPLSSPPRPVHSASRAVAGTFHCSPQRIAASGLTSKTWRRRRSRRRSCVRRGTGSQMWTSASRLVSGASNYCARSGVPCGLWLRRIVCIIIHHPSIHTFRHPFVRWFFHSSFALSSFDRSFAR